MKKIVLPLTIASLLLFLNFQVQAKQEDPVQVQNQNQIQTQNQGEEEQIQVTNQEEEGQSTGQPKEVAPRSETARERMSEVAKKVEEILTSETRFGGIGEQVRELARQQNQAQEQIQEQWGLIEARRGWLKKLLGPDFGAVNNLKQQTAQNQVRIRQLEQLQDQLTNQGDLTIIQEMVQALQDQNTALQERIQTEEENSSLLGWLFRLLNR